MNEREKKLLDIAISIIELNPDINPRITGSLLLALKGINKRREAQDVDFVCDDLCETESGYPIMPKGFKEVGMDGRRSCVEAIQFINEDGLKIEFMQNCETNDDGDNVIIDSDYIVPCGKLYIMILRKQTYIVRDLSEESKKKHSDDLEFLFANNDNAIFLPAKK